MKCIGLISDTHGYIHPKLYEFFKDVDEIWHAGDIGNLQVFEDLCAFKKVQAVFGNVDGYEIRTIMPEELRFDCEEISVWIKHIGGYPGKYDVSVREKIFANPPKLFISGHSHILKIMNDKKLNFLHINPGAAGKYGFHNVMTMVKFEVAGEKIQNLNYLELPKK